MPAPPPQATPQATPEAAPQGALDAALESAAPAAPKSHPIEQILNDVQECMEEIVDQTAQLTDPDLADSEIDAQGEVSGSATAQSLTDFFTQLRQKGAAQAKSAPAAQPPSPPQAKLKAPAPAQAPAEEDEPVLEAEVDDETPATIPLSLTQTPADLPQEELSQDDAEQDDPGPEDQVQDDLSQEDADVVAHTSHSTDLAVPPDIYDDRIVAVARPTGLIAEEYRALRTTILARWEQRRHLVHLITSATPQEGKTLTSLNLGLTMAELHNRRTIVIEADLRIPQFSNLLSLPPSPGLASYLDGQASLKDVIQPVGPNQLHVIPAGTRAAERAIHLLSSNTMVKLLAELRKRYDHVIIDTPPIIDLADAGILGRLSDEVLLIVRLNRTPRSLVEQALSTLASYRAPVSGLIATDQKPRGHGKYYKYGSNSYRRYYYHSKAS
ncbi:MAG: CpsD/CapB family tyrosine-protein kinase [Phycisphaeraceae bacterium]|nr:CpsD/CapB family tyrosine-protein kinase [Phycisphaeraceae bacterium]